MRFCRIMVYGAMVLAASGVLAAPAASTVGERLILDGCKAGGGGNDIHSLQSHYEPDRDQIVVTVRLGSATRRKAACRVHLDHATSLVGRAATPAGCTTTADSVISRTSDGHRGMGSRRVQGDLVRFVVPLAELHVGKPKDVP